MTPLVIEDPAALARFAGGLDAAPRVALDTEAASFHRYVDRVYLVQLSTDAATAIVDPLAVDDLSVIGRLLADPDKEVIFHDADYDLRILDRDFGFRARRLWDTRVAAQLAGETAFGLGSLLAKHFGVRLSKKLQRADWSRRPLTDEMIAYAAADTAHLPALRDRLEAALRALGRLHWAEEEFARLEMVRWSAPDPEALPFLRLKGARRLRGPALAVLQAVWAWRESTAERLDRAPFRVLGNDGVVGIAQAAPRTRRELEAVPGVARSIAQRHGDDLLTAVGRGLATPETAWPKVVRRQGEKPDPAVEERYQRLRALRADRAKIVHLDPGLLCPNATLQAIAQGRPTTREDLDRVPDLRQWQAEAMGEAAILRSVAG